MTLLFHTTAVNHLASKIYRNRKQNITPGKCTIKRFSDGEVYVRIEQDVRNRTVWVLAATNPPGDNILELLFLLDALQREGAKINLLFTYFGYARQDRREKGESLSAEVICSLIARNRIKKVNIIHPHGHHLQHFLRFKGRIPIDLYDPIVRQYEAIVAPDKGSLKLAQEIQKRTGVPLIAIEKKRPAQEKVRVVAIKGDVKNKRVIMIDDMIATGGTIIAASRTLRQGGAGEIAVLATHGIFSNSTIENIKQSPITKVYVTNSLPQKKQWKNLTVVDLSRHICLILDEKK